MKDIHDIAPPVPVGIDPFYIKVLVAALGVLVLAGLLLLFFRFLKKRRAREKKSLYLLPEPLPPHQAAIEEMDAFLYLMESHPRLFYFRLTGTLKRFIGKCLDFNAPEMTTQELAARIRRLELDREEGVELRDFLVFADTIKYAGITPDHRRMEQDDAFARRFVARIHAMTGEEKEAEVSGDDISDETAAGKGDGKGPAQRPRAGGIRRFFTSRAEKGGSA
ncbi:MAG TPA: hypothetical protein VJ936_08120 [Desulfobacteraceae bacterium]|nr:hypothetical protein [Desulfobacteraceae bacterium]